MSPIISPFLAPGLRTRADSLAIIHLSRDALEPLYLQSSEGEHDGYAEGAVLNTRFGSFPHSTLIGVPWGSQVRASKVDTGSRGRKRKRNLEDAADQDSGTPGESADASNAPAEGAYKGVKEAVTASSGFIHVLPPTPESWTISLPHRTQVVYTPDYSIILQRIRARPGSRLIEAGAGSGSFTHAAARAVYSGYPTGKDEGREGKVFSYELHEERFRAMTAELGKHGLEGIVELTQRDVYGDGFLVDGASPGADAIFLDLPAPWRALPHLSRRRHKNVEEAEDEGCDLDGEAAGGWTSPLNPEKSVYICTFSPCIEQVTRTVSAMRKLGWVEIEVTEIANKKIHVSREKVSPKLGADRGANPIAKDVTEAVSRLKEIEKKTVAHNEKLSKPRNPDSMDLDPDEVGDVHGVDVGPNGVKQGKGGANGVDSVKPWMQGQLVTRTDGELKSHTSYLVFAILPREWSDEEEAAALARWPCGQEQRVIGSLDREARKEEKRRLMQPKKKRKGGPLGTDDATAETVS